MPFLDSNARPAPAARPPLRLVVGGRQDHGAVPDRAFVSVAPREPLRAGERRRMTRRHVLMLLLALEVLVLGLSNADRYRKPPAATVDAPSVAGHVIT